MSHAEGQDVMDEALAMLEPFAPSYRGGLSNHGPMTVEALVSVGRQDAVIPWVERYRKRLEPRSKPTKAIDADHWIEALGDRARGGDWDLWFGEQLKESPWRDVVGLWVPRLAPGIAAAGLHGVIRVGHAVCSLAAAETPLRLEELARALAYWASDYLRLPGERAAGGKLTPSQALGKLERLPDERRGGRGLITTQLKELTGFAPFTDSINLVDPEAGSPSFIADLVATFAGVFVNTGTNSFDFLHAVTGAAAIDELLPYVPKEQHAEVLAYAWQVNAAGFARYSAEGLSASINAEGVQANAIQLVQGAVASGDEHTIKLVAACNREHRRNPDPRLMAAAAKRVARHG